HQAESHVADSLSHLSLSSENVGNHLGQRAVVANAASEQKIDVVLHAFIHNAALQLPALDRTANAAEATDAIDGPQMVLVAGFENVAAIQPHAETRAEQRLLNIVRRQGIAGKQSVNVAAADERRDMLDAAGV